MTQSVLFFVTLYGFSFSIWGLVGLCRLIYEKRESFRQPRVGKFAIGLFGITFALMPPFVVVMEAMPFQERLPGGEMVTNTLFLAAWVSGMLITASVARVFRIAFQRSVLVMLAAWIGLVVTVLINSLGWAETSAPGVYPLVLGIFGFSLVAGWVGLIASERRARNLSQRPKKPGVASTANRNVVGIKDVAVLIPAHNEEQSIGACLKAITALVSPENIFVASDGSTDNTTKIVGEWGCNVVDINPGLGKAKALNELLIRFEIGSRYKVVMILDADSEVDPHYFERGLPLFDDPGVTAVAGHAFPAWEPHRFPRWNMFFIAYRVRLYKVTQAFLRYGQTWRPTNVSFIIPGFASMYRSEVLPKIDITAPGLIIEDFNMTFEVQHKKLGKIAYLPAVRCMCQDPTTLRDYIRQVKRWDLGLWQTVRRHGIWPSLFWLSLGVFLVEISVQSAMFLTAPYVLLWFLAGPGGTLSWWSPIGAIDLQFQDVLVGILLADYLLTVVIALLERKPMLLVYGLGFLLPRLIDSFLFLATFPMAFFVRSDGRWVSPQRSQGAGKT